ncbi:MAG: SIR2 family protein [Micrococcales bacterium]|nr:SIR2 family protein [Micrococcales bacterium]
MEPSDISLDDELLSSIENGTCVLFLGAGFTNAFSLVGGEGVATASELGETIVDSLKLRLNGLVPTDRVVAATTSLLEDGTRSYHLRLAAQFFISELVRHCRLEPEKAREELIEILVRETGKSFGRETIAAAAPLLSLPWSSIYTTNYDSLIEATLSASGIGYQVTSRPSDLVERAGDRLEVVKIHGSIDEVHLDRELPLVITTDDYASFGSTRGLLLDELRVNLAKRDFLFLGYGLHDENLDTVIREVSRAISRTPRSLYVLTRDEAEEPWWNYLKLRRFKVRRSQDLVRLAGDLTHALSAFRTNHDAGYVEYAITSRNALDEPYEASDLTHIRATVSSQNWESSRPHGAPVNLTSCGDDLVASLYFYLRTKRAEKAEDGGEAASRLRASTLQGFLDSFASRERPSRGNWHRALECLALAAQDYDNDNLPKVVDILRANSQHHEDTLSRWLTLQLLRELQMKVPENGAGLVDAYVVSEARTWRSNPNTDAGRKYRPVIPRLAWNLFRTGNYHEFLSLDDSRGWEDLLLTWELSKVSGGAIYSAESPREVTTLGDKVRVDSGTVRLLLGRGEVSSLAQEMANPLVRRASLRHGIDTAWRTWTSDQGSTAIKDILEYVDAELRKQDRSAGTVEPFFASFALLEHLSMLREESECDSDDLTTAYRQLMEAGRDAVDLLSVTDQRDEATRCRASHFATAMIRELLHGARTLEQRDGMTEADTALFEELTSKVTGLCTSNEHEWMLENLLNVSVHLARLPDSTPLIRQLLDCILAAVRSEGVWTSLSPLLRYYVFKFEHGGEWRARG